MNISAKEVKRSFRDLQNITNDLLNSNIDNYLNLVKRFIQFSHRNKIICRIVEPLLTYHLDEEKYKKRYTNNHGEIEVPIEIEEHIAFVLQLFNEISNDEKFRLIEFLINHITTNYGDHLELFNRNIVAPAIREFLNRINDFIEDEVEGKVEVEISRINIFNVGSISNKNGNIAIGNHISIIQSTNIENLSDEFAKAILNHGFSISEFDKVKIEINELKEELKKQAPNHSVITNIFSKVFKVGGKLMAEILFNLISKPELSMAVAEYLR